ncbi:MAG: hypothetical protein ACYC4L_01220 [Chloroflexota bacterium]
MGRDRVGFLIASSIGLMLYLPLLSHWYDLNGLYEARAVDTGIGLLSPNHMLFRPIGFLVLRFLGAVGYVGLSVGIMQVVTAICGAFGLGFAYLLFRRLSGSTGAALALSTGMGITSSYWVYSTDISYIVPALVPVAAALLRIVSPPIGVRGAVTLGLLCSLAALLWQANIVLVPVLAAWLLFLRERMRVVSVFLVVSAGLVGLTYLLVAMTVYGQSDLGGAVAWAVRYGGSPLPQWGQFQPDRVLLAVIHQLASIGPLANGMRLDQFWAVASGSVWARLALADTALLVLWSLTLLFRARSQHRTTFWLVAGYLAYFAFIVWWDPFEPKWFLVPNLFLVSMLATVWWRLRPLDTAILSLCVAVLGLCNLEALIWPRYAQPNPSLITAQCVAEHTNRDDIVMVGDWRWNGYLDYFYARKSIPLLGNAAALGGKERVLLGLSQLVDSKRQSGAEVYMSDWEAYSADHLSWFTEQTSIGRDELRRFHTEPAFTCNGVSLVRVLGYSGP